MLWCLFTAMATLTKTAIEGKPSGQVLGCDERQNIWSGDNMVLGLLPGWHCVPKEKWHSQIWRRTYKVEGYMEGLRGAQQGRGAYGYRGTIRQSDKAIGMACGGEVW